ncbi:thiol-disulfide oxidoreductase DCC [Haladaptatus sp. R4]|uniref:thiol-disulfide oxidoreductase DCC family protein n=1 Tax=Haladaptatus sp. R4 TaxID=1679489 RepID=UPI0007B4F08A|nr:thiol-disulfide oxidoreductase DCC [Haladaptatus sp. R4]
MATEPDSEEPTDGPDHPVLLFDGVCNLCNAVVRFTVRFDEAGTFRFAPLQSEVGQSLLSRHDLPMDEFDSFVLVDGENCYTRSTAALRVCRELDGPWPLLYPLIYLPEAVRDPVYDLIAKYRYRIFGRKDECPIPPPEIRERFVERSLDSV